MVSSNSITSRCSQNIPNKYIRTPIASLSSYFLASLISNFRIKFLFYFTFFFVFFLPSRSKWSNGGILISGACEGEGTRGSVRDSRSQQVRPVVRRLGSSPHSSPTLLFIFTTTIIIIVVVIIIFSCYVSVRLSPGPRRPAAHGWMGFGVESRHHTTPHHFLSLSLSI